MNMFLFEFEMCANDNLTWEKWVKRPVERFSSQLGPSAIDLGIDIFQLQILVGKMGEISNWEMFFPAGTFENLI